MDDHAVRDQILSAVNLGDMMKKLCLAAGEPTTKLAGETSLLTRHPSSVEFFYDVVNGADVYNHPIEVIIAHKSTKWTREASVVHPQHYIICT